MTDRTQTFSPVALFAAFLLLMSGVAFAQPPGGSEDGAQGGNHLQGEGQRERGPRGVRGQERLFQALNLDQDQQQAWTTVLEEAKVAGEPLMLDVRENREALQAAIEADADATTIGELTLKGKELRALFAEHREATEADLVTILDSEQREKFEEIQAKREERGPGGPHGRRGHGRRGGQPGGSDNNG